MTGHPKTVRGAREILLRHPLSNTSDIRLVSAIELLLMEYQILDTLPCTDSNDPRCQRHLEEGRTRMDAWEAEWDAVLGGSYERFYSWRIELNRTDSPDISSGGLYAANPNNSAKLRLHDCEIASTHF
jgi:hypothetical protein